MITFEKMDLKHLPVLWEMIKSYPNYFDDTMNIKNLQDFQKWFISSVIDGMVFVNNKIIVGCGYIDNIHNGLARINLFKKRKGIEFYKIFPYYKQYRKYFICKHNIKMLYAIARVDNLASLQLLKLLDFKIADILKEHEIVNGQPIDCIMAIYMEKKSE